jgi:hypothetical protein
LTIVARKPASRTPRGSKESARPSGAQRAFLSRGLSQPGGKLPLFDEFGQHYNGRTIRSCIAQGWAEPWFDNPIKRNWMVCKLTTAGRAAVAEIAANDGESPIGPDFRLRCPEAISHAPNRGHARLRLVAAADCD